MQNGESKKVAARSPLSRAGPLLGVFAIIAVILAVFIRARIPRESLSAGIAANLSLPLRKEAGSEILPDVEHAPASYEEYLLEGIGKEITDARLRLTEAQRERLRDLHHSDENVTQLAIESVRIRGELYDLLATDAVSEQEVLDKVNRLNEALSDLRTARARIILELRKILTVEQRKIALTIIQEQRALAGKKSVQLAPQGSPSVAPSEEQDLTENFEEEPHVDEASSE